MNERIKELREVLKLSGEKFGEKLGVGKTAISRLENGSNNVTSQMIKSICREFNVNEEWLKYGTGDMFNSAEDSIAECVGELLTTHDDALYNMIKSILMTYRTLDDKSKKVIQEFILTAVDNSKKNKDDK